MFIFDIRQVCLSVFIATVMMFSFSTLIALEADEELPGNDVVVVTTSHIDLSKEAVRTKESWWPNLLCDILRESFEVDIALENGGGIRSVSEGIIIPKGNITSKQLSEMFPFDETYVTMKLNGKSIKEILERGVSLMPKSFGGFMHVSGLKYVIDVNQQPQLTKMDFDGKPCSVMVQGNRIMDIKVLSSDGVYKPLETDREYSIVTNSFIAGGGDGFFMFKDGKETWVSIVKRCEFIKHALRGMKKVSPGTEKRVTILTPAPPGI